MQGFLPLLAPQDVRVGLFAMLRLKNFPEGAFFHDNPWQGAGVDGHPVCVVGTSNNGTLSCCLTVTSFQNTTLERKFPDPADLMRRQYLAIDHSASTTSGTGQLTLANGQRMLKQSYLHLDNFIVVETRHLEVWKNNDKFLNVPSTDRLVAQFTDFLEGQIPRPLYARGGGLSPLDMFQGKYTPESLGMPQVSLQRRGSYDDLFPDITGAPTAPVATNSSSFNAWGRGNPTFVRPRTGNCAIRIVSPPRG
jgi:hypothetical protein